MEVNKDFYGYTDGIRIRGGAATPGYTTTEIYAANFTDASPATETAGQLASGVSQGLFEFGAALDGSIQTHGIPFDGQSYNTLANFRGVDSMGSSDNMTLRIGIEGSVPIIWGYHPRTSLTYNTNYSARPVSYSNVLWGPQKSESPDATSLVPIIKMDFKTLLYVPLIIASKNTYNSVPDEYGRLVLSESWKTAAVFTLETYLNSYFMEYPSIQGVGLMSFAVDLQDDGSIPGFDFYRCRISNQIAPFRNLMYNWTAGTVSSGHYAPTDGEILASGMDLCGPFMAQRDVVFNYTTTAGTIAQYTEPTGGNIPLILGCTMLNAGYRRQSPDLINNFWKGVTSCYGANHIRFAYQTNAEYIQVPVWYDAPQLPEILREAVHRMMSYLGVMWADDIGGIETGDRTIYIGTIGDDGLATGTYTRVSDPSEIRQLASDDFINDSEYDPERIDPNVYTDVMESGTAPDVGSCNRYYALDRSNLGILYSALTQTLDRVPTGEKEEYLLSHFLTTSPGDLIVSLKWYPFDFYNLFFNTTEQPKIIFIGDLPLEYKDLNVVGYKARTNTSFSITTNIGFFKLFRKYDDFRDYSPYTSCTIYTPFCTSIKLDLSVCMDHNIYVQMCIDLLTGACTAVIRLDSTEGIIVGTSSGSCGVDLPVSSLDQATYNNATFSAIQQSKSANIQLDSQYVGAVFSGVMTAATAGSGRAPLGVQAAEAGHSAGKGVVGILRAWDTKIAADYNLSHIPEQYKQISAVTSTLSMLLPLNSYAIIERPQMLPGDHSQYGHTVGYKTLYNGRLGDLSGYTVCQTADLSGFAAPSSVKDMIYQALKSGVYV